MAAFGVVGMGRFTQVGATLTLSHAPPIASRRLRERMLQLWLKLGHAVRKEIGSNYCP
jgi:hypothetical protein